MNRATVIKCKKMHTIKCKKDDLGLKPALQEILNLKTKHVIQLHPVIRQHTSPEGGDMIRIELPRASSSGSDEGEESVT